MFHLFYRKIAPGLTQLLQWVYPPTCLHCECSLSALGPLFCAVCLENLPLSEAKGRCTTCFFELGKGGCQRCRKRSYVIGRQMAALEWVGPGKTLALHVQSGERKAIAAAASLMVYQWLKRERPMPDFIVPVPLHWMKRLGLDGDPHRLLAEAVAKLLAVPILSALKISYDHAGFMRGEAMQSAFSLSSRAVSFADKRLLLILPKLDDALLRQAGIALGIGGASGIDALTLCIEDV